MTDRICRVCGRVLLVKNASISGIVYLYCPRCKRTETSLSEEEMANDFGWSNRRDLGWEIRNRQRRLRPIVDRLDNWFRSIEPDHPAGQRARDPYAVLGVSSCDPPEKVRSRFKELANRYHPDRPGGNEEAMRRINKAYAEIKSRDGKGARR